MHYRYRKQVKHFRKLFCYTFCIDGCVFWTMVQMDFVLGSQPKGLKSLPQKTGLGQRLEASALPQVGGKDPLGGGIVAAERKINRRDT